MDRTGPKTTDMDGNWAEMDGNRAEMGRNGPTWTNIDRCSAENGLKRAEEEAKRTEMGRAGGPINKHRQKLERHGSKWAETDRTSTVVGPSMDRNWPKWTDRCPPPLPPQEALHQRLIQMPPRKAAAQGLAHHVPTRTARATSAPIPLADTTRSRPPRKTTTTASTATGVASTSAAAAADGSPTLAAASASRCQDELWGGGATGWKRSTQARLRASGHSPADPPQARLPDATLLERRSGVLIAQPQL